LELKQVEFAEILGLTQQQYNRYERQIGQPSLEQIIKIVDRLNKYCNEKRLPEMHWRPDKNKPAFIIIEDLIYLEDTPG